jgi:hypothetical protein
MAEMTVNDIEVMLHYYCSPSPHPRIDAPAVQDAISQFLAAGLLEYVKKDIYEATEGGKMYVEALRKVPIPKRQWVLPSE